MLIIEIDIPHLGATEALVEEIRAPRIAFKLRGNQGVIGAGSFVTELQEPYLPITEEKLISVIEGAFPSEEPEEEE